MAHRNSVPLGAIVLGVAGLIPFLGFAALAVSGTDGGLSSIGLSPRTILSAYGAVIASFLGGIRWGAAAARNAGNGDYLVAIVPSLVAWAAMAAPAPWDLRILGGLVLAWASSIRICPGAGSRLSGSVACAWFSRASPGPRSSWRPDGSREPATARRAPSGLAAHLAQEVQDGVAARRRLDRTEQRGDFRAVPRVLIRRGLVRPVRLQKVGRTDVQRGCDPFQ